MEHQKRFVRSNDEDGKKSEVLQNKIEKEPKECRNIVCKGKKGDRGPRGPKGDVGIRVFAGAVKKAEKGQKGDRGAQGPPGPSLEKPKIIEGPRDVEGNEGGAVIFSCKSQGNPKPEVSWKINGMRINTKNERMKINRDGVLQILNIQASDTGTVQCIAKNFFGEMSAEAALKVNSK